ncbi:MAG: FAD-dependent oxidoreductase [Thermodesulfobacteriota bacterium]
MPRLDDRFRLSGLELKNRLVMTAMSTGLAGPQGQVTDRLVEYYAARAAGGVALITVEEACPHPGLPHVRGALAIHGDHLRPGLEKLTSRLHAEGALAALQIGLYFRPAVSGFPRYVAWAGAPDAGPEVKELTAAEIQYLTGLFAAAARRARSAGFDAVEIHACHGCLLAEFLSPYWNQRTDEYGRDRAGRFRFPLEVLAAVRSALGRDFPVIFRLSGSEFHEPGFSLEDAAALARELEAGGASAVNVSGGLGHINHISIPPSAVPRGILLPLAEAVKKAVGLPVIAGNSLTPEMAARAVATGQADLIGLGRPLIVDPEWPRKVLGHHRDQIRPCLRCNQGCFGGLRHPGRGAITCLYNPTVGREGETLPGQAPKKLKVIVIGGGPAGCEAARVARLRGHEVILLEKADRLGGQFNLAAAAPGKEDFLALIEYYTRELSRLGVRVNLETEATPARMAGLAADVFILAVGAIPYLPPIPGRELPQVTTAHAVLAGQSKLTAGPAVIVGGGAVGLETAAHLANRGLEVTVVEMLVEVARDIQPGIGVRELLLASLERSGVEIHTGLRVEAITPEAVIASDRPLIGGGRQWRFPAGLVVLATGVRIDPGLDELAAAAPGPCFRVGDCSSPGQALEAVHAAFDLARSI